MDIDKLAGICRYMSATSCAEFLECYVMQFMGIDDASISVKDDWIECSIHVDEMDKMDDIQAFLRNLAIAWNAHSGEHLICCVYVNVRHMRFDSIKPSPTP
jgi:hypothetical protein